ncbi:MAG: hypothetical protein A2087_10995 [Spirochaetes bacterium GWD1_61_31]|nr:MAG: hypothetical protein A2Y37_10055 [Spirochaetes bacterium GWB1_60_80]OHD29075.1 MAG: hypothetical protein A2004_14595 [Spirochaetes bacterium GWC1_61_12]OHD43106.1 MAG: hypothetical protein A2087_10995 [Spirochaetes bacterium GWD1_61_31]OHD44240.1 MAG: hypothetical protein A2Y35_06790 [Spirochaetes bacterium GWE1_60_18]OHD60400.1 MAG: hypothetical protein A2Y32_00735 [Spirochaetes bacterium GWF1_60_12]
MEIIGKATINPVLFYSGKVSGYALWVGGGLGCFGIKFIPEFELPVLDILAIAALLLGLIFIAASAVSLGKSTRLGLPQGDTKLKTGGIYRLSRNPMYVGFNLLTIAAMLAISNPVAWVAGLYSMAVYDLIIRGEEKFLAARFGDEYSAYRTQVRRYL